MNNPSLVIMAAGIGSRFGGLKQLAPVGLKGEPILEFSLYDALEVGFKKVVFIIKKELEKDFKNLIGKSLDSSIEVHYVYQEQDMLPEGYKIPQDRVKPWGTGHAILCAKDVIKENFAVINADDYYGKDAFSVMYEKLKNQKDDEKYRFSMVGYLIENTLTDKGHVTRGVCQTKENFLESIEECHQIELKDQLIQYTLDGGKSWKNIDSGTLVSMNLWGFSPGFLNELEKRFPAFLDEALEKNPLKEEYLLPTIVHQLIKEDMASVEVLHSKDQWYGVTYKEDLEGVQNALRTMQKEGLYPLELF